MAVLTPEKFIIEMELIRKSSLSLFDSVETKHKEADDLICAVLIELGYRKGIEIYDEIEKEY